MQKTAKNSVSDRVWDVVVIGGGPAGMMAAGRAAERGRSVLLIEKNPGLGAKLLITGGGRCNVLNAEFDQRALLARFKGADKFLFSAFSKFGVQQALDFFQSRGMPVKVEAEKRAFPVSDSARSVWEVLLEYMKAGGATIRTGASVKGFVRGDDGSIEAAKLTGGDLVRGRAFVLATGGTSHPETGSTGDGIGWLAELGHTVAPASAALVPIELEDAWAKKLAGISLPSAKLTAYQGGQKQAATKGKALFTHFGMSGPAVLNMSAEIADLLVYGDVELSLDLLPQHDFATLNDALQRLFAAESNKKIKNVLGGADGLVPNAFVPVALERAGIDGDTKCNSVTRDERVALMKLLKDLRMKVKGLVGADKAIVASGGVALEEVDFRSMRSRMIPNLYLVGDILDIDRPSGGFSLQLCWTTGFVAGDSA